MGLFSKPTIGLDIGTTQIKAVQMKKGGRAPIIEKIGISPVPPISESDSPEERKEIISGAILNALSNGGISAKKSITSVSGESVIVRYIQMPGMSPDELAGAIRSEAEEYIPYQINEVALTHEVLGEITVDDQRKLNVLLVAVRNEVIDDHVSVLEEAELDPEIIDVDSFALMNSFEINYQGELPESEVVVLVNLGSKVTNINIVQNNISHFSRDIGLAGESITATLQARMRMSREEAEKLKKEIGLVHPGEEDANKVKAFDIISQSFDNIINEVRRSLQFYENQPNKDPITKMFLSGGTSNLKGINEFISEKLGLPTENLNPFEKCIPQVAGYDQDRLRQIAPILGVATGLALRKVISE